MPDGFILPLFLTDISIKMNKSDFESVNSIMLSSQCKLLKIYSGEKNHHMNQLISEYQLSKQVTSRLFQNL